MRWLELAVVGESMHGPVVALPGLDRRAEPAPACLEEEEHREARYL